MSFAKTDNFRIRIEIWVNKDEPDRMWLRINKPDRVGDERGFYRGLWVCQCVPENTYKLNDGLNPAKIGVSDRGL